MLWRLDESLLLEKLLPVLKEPPSPVLPSPSDLLEREG